MASSCLRAHGTHAVLRFLLTPLFIITWTLRLLFDLGVAGNLHALFFVPRFVAFAILLFPTGPLYARLLCRRSTSLFNRYGAHRRQDYDVFLPDSPPRAVVVLISGGAWTLSFKWHGLSCVPTLLAAGYVVVLVDIRQWPIASVTAQVADVRAALIHVGHRVSSGEWGAGLCQYVLAHSAGAHLVALVLLERAGANIGSGGGGGVTSTSARRQPPLPPPPFHPPPPLPPLAAAFLISGAYDIRAFRPHIVRCGLPGSLLDRLFESGDDVYSPTHIVRAHAEHTLMVALATPPRPAAVRSFLSSVLAAVDETPEDLLMSASQPPPRTPDRAALSAYAPPQHVTPSLTTLLKECRLHLIHGALDWCVPSEQSVHFHSVLVGAGVAASLRIADADTHTSLLVESPLCGAPSALDDVRAAIEVNCVKLGIATPVPSVRAEAPLSAFYTSLVAIVNPF